MNIYPKLIMDALATVRYPGNGKNLVEAEMIEDDLRIDGMKVSFSIISTSRQIRSASLLYVRPRLQYIPTLTRMWK